MWWRTKGRQHSICQKMNSSSLYRRGSFTTAVSPNTEGVTVRLLDTLLGCLQLIQQDGNTNESTGYLLWLQSNCCLALVRSLIHDAKPEADRKKRHLVEKRKHVKPYFSLWNLLKCDKNVFAATTRALQKIKAKQKDNISEKDRSTTVWTDLL